MAGSGSNVPDPARISAEVERAAASSVLHGSETLCRLLRFLVQQRLERPEIQIKEYEIATRLLGRPADFDPRIDPVVRVQVGRLRSKLVEYYATQGANDELILEIPKGSYTPHFLNRPTLHPQQPSENPPASTLEKGPAPPFSGRNPWAWIALATVLLFAAGWLFGARKHDRSFPSDEQSRSRSAMPVSDTTARFWAPFISGEQPALIVFSNAPFVGRPETGLRYFDPARDKPADLLDHYTGIGEVFAVSTLHHLFARLNADFRLKRGQLLNWDDARNRPVVFIGSPAENLRLRDLPLSQKFVFEQRYRGPLREIVILNTSPSPGEQAEFKPEPNEPERADYALVTKTVGLDGVSPILMLAGITTLGTEAAVEYTSDDRELLELSRSLNNSFPGSFSAVLAVEVKGGVPVRSRLITAALGR